MINKIKEIPFARILIPWLCGIYLSRMFPALQNHIPVYVLFVSILIFIVLSIICRYAVFRSTDYLQSPLLWLILLSLSFLSYRQAISFHVLPEGKAYYAGIVFSKPETKARSVCTDIRLIGYGDKQGLKSVRDRVRIYIENDTTSKWPAIGDSVFFYARMNRIRNMGNPGEFDYAKYMMNQKIFYSAFLRKKDIYMGRRSKKYTIKRVATHIRCVITETYKKYSIDGGSLAVLTALTTGEREYLDDDLVNQYISAGVMHVLSVSGLHVGILYLLLSFVLFRRNQLLGIRVFRTTIVLLCIWFYAFLTGLSSSVVRASVMFSLFSLGFVFSRQTNGYNTLSASALLTLISNPLELFQPGFQLSYLAVLGILFWQPRLSGIFVFGNSIADKLWQLFTLSFAAQLSTFPISLYYFHQFPTWFWFSNLLVIPGTTVIMITAIVFFFTLPYGPLASMVAFVLKYLLYGLNYFIRWVGFLPFATIEGIRFEWTHLVAVYLFIAGIGVAWYYSSLKASAVCTLVLACFLLTEGILFRTKPDRQEIIIYNAGRIPSISIINNRDHWLLSGAKTPEDSAYLYRRVKNFMIRNGLFRSTKIISIDPENLPKYIIQRDPFILLPEENGLRIRFSGIDLFYPINRKTNCLHEKGNRVGCRYLLVGKESGYPGCWDFQESKPVKIIICESIPWKQQHMWKQFAAENRIIYYDVTCNGALYFRK